MATPKKRAEEEGKQQGKNIEINEEKKNMGNIAECCPYFST
jgi:hypothetical protein